MIQKIILARKYKNKNKLNYDFECTAINSWQHGKTLI